MSLRNVLVALVLVLGSRAPCSGQALDDPRQLRIEERFEVVRILEIPRGQVIDDRLFEALREQIETSAASGRRTALVLDIDSPGGYVDAAGAITDLVRRYRRHETLRIFAFVGPDREAISAAAWIALSCKGLFIAPDASIGDIQPINLGIRGFERVPEKVVSKLVEDVWVDARDNGLTRRYPELFVRAMVDREIDIFAVRNPRLGTPEEFMRASEFALLGPRETQGLEVEEITSPGKPLTASGSALLRFGFAVRLVDHRDRILDLVGTPDASLEVVVLKVRSPLEIDIDWSWVLLLLGIVFLVFELKAPGLGVFGVLGLVALIGFFLVQADFSTDATLPIALLLFGILLVIVEAVLLPGLLVPGITGLLLIVYSTWIAVAGPAGGGLFPDFGDDATQKALGTWALALSGSVVGAFVAGTLLGRFIHRIPLIGKIVILPPRGDSTGGSARGTGAASGGPSKVAVGDRGTTLTPLRPAGLARFSAGKIDVVSRGGFVEAATVVEIIEVAGNRVVVREVREEVPS